MRFHCFRAASTAVLSFVVWLILIGAAHAQDSVARIDIALHNITWLTRPGLVGYATIWDGNKYAQCRRTKERELRCEAAGVMMQPSLRHVLTPERTARLAAQGWVLDPGFGNHVKTFPADMPTNRVAEQIARILADAYDADQSTLETQTAWIEDIPCPPRNGPTQNLAGMVNAAPSMRATAVLGCAYKQDAATQTQTVESLDGLVDLHGGRVTGEIQRLRINHRQRVFVVFQIGLGYVQCMPQPSPPSIYCEAQSAESWPALAGLLTPERVARLRAAGYADPGRSSNYSKSYALASHADAAIAREILTILHEVYGYSGATKLEYKTERP